MSSEGDSTKIAASESNEKVANDLTDSSQDSADLKAENGTVEAKPTENDVDMKDADKPDATTEEESMDSENASVNSEKKEDIEEKPEDKVDSKEDKEEDTNKNDTDAVKKEEKTETKKEVKVKKGTKKESKEEEQDEDEKEQNGDEEGAEEEEEDEEEGEEEEDEEMEEPEKKKKVTASKETKKTENAKPAPKKNSTKAEEKDEDKEEEEVEEEEEEEDEEESEEEEDEPTQVIFVDGGGLPLSEIARVEASVTRFKNDDLRNLHTLLFRMVGKVTMLKKNIKRFNGFTFKKNSKRYKKKIEFLNNLEIKDIKQICEQLDLQKMGSKEDLINKIMDFLLTPKEPGSKNVAPTTGEKNSAGRPKRASAVRANNRGYSSHDDYSSDEKRGARSKGKRPNLKDDSTSDEEFKPGGEEYDSDEKPKVVRGRGGGGGGAGRKRGRPKKDSSEDEPSLSESGEESDFDDEPKAKKKKTPAKAVSRTKKTPSKGRGRGARGSTAKKTPGRGRKAKNSSGSEESEGEGTSSEDEPLSKRGKGKKSGPPTDDEIKKFIKKLLEGANLEEITMKTVCQKVYDNYPDFDLTNKKYFIKSTVKSLIST